MTSHEWIVLFWLTLLVGTMLYPFAISTEWVWLIGTLVSLLTFFGYFFAGRS